MAKRKEISSHGIEAKNAESFVKLCAGSIPCSVS